MKFLSKLLLAFIATILIASCVPTKKYAELENQSLANRRERDSLISVVDKNRYLQFDMKRLEAELEKNDKDYKELKERFAALSQNNQQLLYSYDQLLSQNTDILSTTSTEKQTLTEALAAKQTLLDQKERELARVEEDQKLQLENIQRIRAELQAKEDQYNNTGGQSNDYERQVQELQALLQQKDATLLALRQNVNQALLGFTDSDLTVSEKNGKIYVSLSQSLLFASGSDQIDWKGKKAIIQLAALLNANPDISINVEGHTDSDGGAASNWDLSVRRATAVTKVLTGQGVDAKRVTASGRAFYDPLAPNDSAANKAKNRRTEIILTPKLDQLYQIINQ
ncbi:MAG: chemotaxis protein MotB [Saprospiraceae bacterium]|jgi:chemotaxis protein MotB